MPKSKPTPAEAHSDDQVLAAIERAERHHRRDDPGEMLPTIKEHLGLAHNGWTTRQIRPNLERLEAAGLIVLIRRRRLKLWGLTAKGLKRAALIRDQVSLPEAPQHRRWREATTLAAERIADIRSTLSKTISEADSQLAISPGANSEAWVDLGERLRDACWNLAGATYCLREWPEPSDEQADIDDSPPRLRGRRSPHRWTASK